MHIVCQSTYYTLYQSAEKRCFYIDFGSKTVRMSLCQLLALRHKVMAIPIEHHFDNHLNKHGFEILFLCNKAHLFIVNTLEILDLRQLIGQSFAALGLSTGREAVHL